MGRRGDSGGVVNVCPDRGSDRGETHVMSGAREERVEREEEEREANSQVMGGRRGRRGRTWNSEG